MTLPRLIVAGAAVLCLAGCSTAPQGYVGRFPLSAADPRADLFGTGGGHPLITVPTSLGPILTVREIPYANGVAQDILLGGSRSTAGENKIEVRVVEAPAAGSTGVGDRLTISPPAAETIDDDLARLFPGVDMRVSTESIAGYGRGSFSYASGHLGTTNCVYAWQYTAATQPMTLFEGASGSGRETTSVRLRLCRTLSMAALLDIVQQMANASGGGVDPIFGGAAAPEVYRRPMDDPSPRQVQLTHTARRRVMAVRTERPRAFSDAPRVRAGAGDGPRIPLPGEVAMPQAPGSPPASRPASDLPLPPS